MQKRLFQDENKKWLRMSAIVDKSQFAFSSESIPLTQKVVITRLISENLLIFLLQYMGLVLSTLTVDSFPLWLASGTSCAFIFLRGSTILPGIWLGSFAAYYFAKTGFLVAFECASIFALQAQLLLWISYRFISPTLIFYHPKPFIKFIFAFLFIAMITALALIISTHALLRPTLILWTKWSLANFNGILILAIALITWDAYFPQIYSLNKLNKKLLSLVYGTLITLLLLLIFSKTLILSILLLILVCIMMLGVSTQYGWCGCISAALLFGLALMLKTNLNGFINPEIPSIPFMISLQLVLALSTMIGLGISTMQWYKKFKN